MKRAALLLLIVPLALVARPRAAQQPPLSSPAAATSEDQPDDGFPVTSDLVKRKCSACHRADEKGRLTRISYRRTTPEGWEQTIKRMVTLNDVKIEPAEAREIVRYLADHQGLAPEEAQPAAFEVERRKIDFQFANKNATRTAADRRDLHRLPLDGPRDLAAAHQRGMGAARRDAPRLLPARPTSRLPPRRSDAP